MAVDVVELSDGSHETCPYQKLYPTVFMVKSAEDRSCGNLTKPLDHPMASPSRGQVPYSRAAAMALPAALCLNAGTAVAQYCDNLEGQEVKITGTVEKTVDAAGVVFFRDKKTAMTEKW